MIVARSATARKTRIDLIWLSLLSRHLIEAARLLTSILRFNHLGERARGVPDTHRLNFQRFKGPLETSFTDFRQRYYGNFGPALHG